jgi:glycosyltransferase involved in cell wall biosynthesis
MNILMNCLSSVSGGAVSYLRNLVPLLNKQVEVSSDSHGLTILAHESQKELFVSIPEQQCIWINEARLIGWRRMLWERRNLARIVKKDNADVVFTPYQIGPRIKGAKQVLMIRNMEPFYSQGYRYRLKSRLRNNVLRRQSTSALSGADRVIAVSEFAEDMLVDGLGLPNASIRKIYHGRDTAFSPIGDSDEDRDRLQTLGVDGDFLLTCGSVLPYRRYEDVIAAFNLCAGTLSSDVKLVIAGSGTDHRYADLIQRAIANSPYQERILAVGHVSRADMISLYRRCLACIIATEIEACPNIAIEAMSSGCAIVSSDRAPLPEMFGESSLQFPSRNIDALKDRILTYLHNDDLRSEMGERAQRRASDFSWDKCATETFAALTDWSE